jgi:hypothetical protein
MRAEEVARPMTDGLKKRVRELEEDVRRLTADPSADAKPRTRRVNVAGRVNSVVSGTIGGAGSSHAASSSQKVRIRQDRGGTSEDVVTVERTARLSQADQESSRGEPGPTQGEVK